MSAPTSVSQFSVPAALFGLRAIPAHSRLVVTLCVVHVAAAFVLAPFAWPAFGAFLDAFGDQDAANPAAMMAAMSRLVPLALFEIVLLIVTQAAVLRALVNDISNGGIFGLWLGGDELRLAVINVAVGGLGLAVFFAASTVLSSLGSLLNMAQGGAAAGAVLGFGAMIWLWVRLSPAAAASIGEGRLMLRPVWSLTEGRFAPLLVALVLAIVGVQAASAVVSAFIAPSLEPAEGQTREAAYAVLAGDLGGRVQLALGSAMNPLIIMVTSGVGAYAYRMWARNDAPVSNDDASVH